MKFDFYDTTEFPRKLTRTVECKPVVVNGEVIHGYFVMPDGNIISQRQTKPKILKPQIAGNTKYPKVGLVMNDGDIKTLYLHRIACEAYHPFPVPEGVTKAEWKVTPASVKRLVSGLFQVNHIDHNHVNFHPDNLEWVTVKQNAEKYQEHRMAA